MCVLDLTRLPEDVRSHNPSPAKLPEDCRPPLPSPAHFHLLLHWGTSDFGARDTPRAMPLAGDDVHQAKDDDLENGLDGIFHRIGGNGYYRT